MLKCLWEGKRISVLDLHNEYGERRTDRIHELKRAANRKELRCEECGSLVTVKSGVQKRTHFAHLPGANRDCYFETHVDSEDKLEAKFLLSHILSKQYEVIDIDRRLKNGFRVDIYIQIGSGASMGIMLLPINTSSVQWEDMSKEMSGVDTPILWIVLQGQSKPRPFLVAYLLDVLDRLLIFNSREKAFTLCKKASYFDRNGTPKDSVVFEKTYAIGDIKINPAGSLECDFDEKFAIYEQDFRKGKIAQENEVLAKRAMATSKRPPRVCSYCGQETTDYWKYDPNTSRCICNTCWKKNRAGN